MPLENEADRMRHVPDPTDRTLGALQREIEQLEDKIDTAFDHKEEVNVVRHQAIQTQLNLMEAHRLELRDIAEKQRLEQKEDTKVAVDAALTAQKEAVRETTIATNLANAKSESAMTKALEQMAATFTAALASVTGTVVDLKERVSGMDQYKRGGAENQSDKRLDMTMLIQIIAVATAIYLGLSKNK